jgi:hypothetical protein
MRLLMIAGALALAGCATTESDGDLLGDMFAPVSSERVRTVEAKAAAAGQPLGSEHNPIRVSMPAGQRAYLARLRCSDGSAPAFARGGSVGEGPYGKIMDVYELKCSTGTPATASVYMDMYHDHVEDRPVPGFTIAPQ